MSKSKTKTKIALVLPSLQPGGMERVMSELANYFSSKSSIEVHLVLFGRSPRIFFNINKNVYVHKRFIGNGARPKLLEGLRILRYIRKEIKTICPDSVLSFGTQWNNITLLALLKTSFPVFISDRGCPTRRYKFFTELLRKAMYRTATGIIAQTENAKKIQKRKMGNPNIIAIGNPISKISKIENIDRENIILSVGRLIRTKHHDRLIKIFYKLKRPGWKLIIVGADALREENYNRLKALVERLHLEENVKLEGEQKIINCYFNKSKIFAFTSSVEGFPNVVGEALSAGLPVISYDCASGPSEMIIDDWNGFLVNVFDDRSFLEKLQILIDDEDKRKKMGVNAERSIENFSLPIIGDKYLRFILPQYDGALDNIQE